MELKNPYLLNSSVALLRRDTTEIKTYIKRMFIAACFIMAKRERNKMNIISSDTGNV